MSFQNEDDEEDLSPNLSSEELDELTNKKNYKEDLINSLNEQEILNKKKQEKDIYKMFSQSRNNINERKNKIYNELNFGYANNNLNVEESNNINDNIETANFFQEEINIKNSNDNDSKNNNNKIETYNNKRIYENKNANIDTKENNVSQNYQSFLAERLNLIHQNLNEEGKKETNDNDNKEQQQQKNNDYYKYENFSKKDIMNYYFNVDNKINNINNINSINQDEKKYMIEKNTKNIVDNNKKDSKENSISLQQNDVKINVNSNQKINNIINKIESKNKPIIDVSNKISEIQTNIKDSNPNKSKINNPLKNSSSTLNIEDLNQINLLKRSLINNIPGFNTTKNIKERNLSLEHNKSVDTLESVNIKRMEEEEAGRKIIIEDEYKKLSLLEKEKMKLIEEEKLLRKKILEEIERQENAKKKKEMRRIKYFERVKKKEEDEKKLKEIKLKQEKELKEIYELKNKKKIEEEKLLMIMEGKLKLNNQEINNYKNNLLYEYEYDNSITKFNKEDIISKDNMENKTRITSNDKEIDKEIDKEKDKEIDMNNQLEKINYRTSINSDAKYAINEEEKINNKTKVNQILNPSIILNKEKEIISTDNMSLSPSLSSFSNKNSLLSLKAVRNNIDKYDNKKSNLKHLISFSPSLKEESIKDNSDLRSNKYMTNTPKENNWNLVDINVSDFYENKKKKYMKRKRTENNSNYNTNVYNNKKVFEKLMDNIDSYNQNKLIKENKDLNEVNKIQEITTKAKNDIDKTINAINNLNKKVKTIDYNTEKITVNRNSTIVENPYLKYGKRRLKEKNENDKVKSNKFNFNLNSRNFNGYFSDNYERINPHKSFKDNNLDKIQNNENIDLSNYETISYVNYKKHFENKKEKNKIIVDKILADKNIKFDDYFKKMYTKNIK